MADDVYTANLKEALTGSRDAEFVWLCNFEVENEWAHGRPGLPAARVSATAPTVRRMEELGALLAEPGDHLLLGAGLDPGYRRYIESAGLGLPTEITDESHSPGSIETGTAVLDSPVLLRRLRALADRGAYLMPMGSSPEVTQIAEASGLKLAVPDANTARRVNSKIYSRRLVEELNLHAIPGHCCETVDEFRAALTPLPTQDKPVIVKDAYGVSGKGLLVLDDPARADSVLRMAERRAQRNVDRSMYVVVEQFVHKRLDLNYQITISRTGKVSLDFVRQTLTSGGVHQANVIPVDISERVHDEIAHAAEVVGAALFADGYFGVAGIDALLTVDDVLHPVLEINARLTMSTYQGRVLERFHPPGSIATARHYPLRLAKPVTFDEVGHALGDLAKPPVDGTGVLVTCFGTVNAQAAVSTPFEGRLYAVLVAKSHDELWALDAQVERALAPLNVTGVSS
jgi:hypothetical protein